MWLASRSCFVGWGEVADTAGALRLVNIRSSRGVACECKLTYFRFGMWAGPPGCLLAVGPDLCYKLTLSIPPL